MGQARNLKAEIDQLKAQKQPVKDTSSMLVIHADGTTSESTVDEVFAGMRNAWNEELACFNRVASFNADLEVAKDALFSKVVKSKDAYELPGGDYKVAFFSTFEKAKGHMISQVDIVCQVTQLESGKSIIRGFNLPEGNLTNWDGEEFPLVSYVKAAALWVLENKSLMMVNAMKNCFSDVDNFQSIID